MAAPASSPTIDVSKHLEEIRERGYTILEEVLAPSFVDGLAEALARVEVDSDVRPARNEFEGTRTLRVYNLLARDRIFERVPVEPNLLAVVEGVLDPGCLVSSLSSINIGPGETAQLVHSDDQVIGLPRPHPAVVCNSMWALTDFTAANGATRLVPGSHLLDHGPHPAKPCETIPAEMARGSVLVWHGSLWHGGGANRTDDRRLGLAMNYCAGFIRQQENQQLGIPREVARKFSPRLRQLVGYGTYRSLIGHIDRKDPATLFGDDPGLRLIWDT